jgi:hypothetical protein
MKVSTPHPTSLSVGHFNSWLMFGLGILPLPGATKLGMIGYDGTIVGRDGVIKRI